MGRYKSPYAHVTSNTYTGEGSTGTRLSDKMDEVGMSKNELARVTGLSYTTILRMCSGDRIGTLASWMMVCEALGVSVSDIVEADDGRQDFL